MKTAIKKYLVLATLMIGSLISYANGNNTDSNFLNEAKVKVEFYKVKKGELLSIKNEEGEIIYSLKIKNSGSYSRIFDISKLEEGSYTRELEKDYEIIIKPFSIMSGGITFGKEQVIFKPVIRAKNDLILISKLNFEKEPAKISLYYNNDLIFFETLKSSEALLKRIYKLSEKEEGSYRVVMYCNNKHYTKKFKL